MAFPLWREYLSPYLATGAGQSTGKLYILATLKLRGWKVELITQKAKLAWHVKCSLMALGQGE